MMMAVIVACIWLACLLSYLASPKQQLTGFSLPKSIGWGAFVLFNAAALYGLNQLFIIVTAMLIWCTLTMAMWLTLTLMAAYFKQRMLLTNAVGMGIFLVVMLVGNHVA